jgi:hypothetical protein
MLALPPMSYILSLLLHSIRASRINLIFYCQLIVIFTGRAVVIVIVIIIDVFPPGFFLDWMVNLTTVALLPQPPLS